MQREQAPNPVLGIRPLQVARPEPPRYYALDSVRATAMLLGIVYHSLLFGMMGGPGPGTSGLGDPSRWLQDWLHSFRMPLFFLISGFFGRMMFEKYSRGEYFRRRWSRIGIPLALGLVTFVPLYVLTRDATTPGFPGVPPRPPVARDHASAVASPEENVSALASRPNGPPIGPVMGPPTPSNGSRARGPFPAHGDSIAERLMGRYTRFFQLHHLWFLWYLLIFVTAAPLIARTLAFMLPRSAVERVGRYLMRSSLAPLALGIAVMPLMLLMPSMFGWSLGICPAIFRAFPDFLVKVDPDMGFYFFFFLAGWWLHDLRHELPRITETWVLNFIVGMATFITATVLSARYSQQTQLPHFEMLRAVACLLYCIGSAATSFAFLGAFMRFLNRPSSTWRYLADTALWVYLVHQPLVLISLAIVRPWNLYWWLQMAVVSLLSVAAALATYELLVRPTLLVRLFGPTRPPRKAFSHRNGSDSFELIV
jgi:fucose 4-O-acetylase-like acetyltransferase